MSPLGFVLRHLFHTSELRAKHSFYIAFLLYAKKVVPIFFLVFGIIRASMYGIRHFPTPEWGMYYIDRISIVLLMITVSAASTAYLVHIMNRIITYKFGKNRKRSKLLWLILYMGFVALFILESSELVFMVVPVVIMLVSILLITLNPVEMKTASAISKARKK